MLEGRSGRADIRCIAEDKAPFFALRWRSIGVPLGNGLDVDQTSFSFFSLSLTPAIEAGSANPKIAAGLRDMTEYHGMSQYSQFAKNLALTLGHEHLLLPKLGGGGSGYVARVTVDLEYKSPLRQHSHPATREKNPPNNPHVFKRLTYGEECHHMFSYDHGEARWQILQARSLFGSNRLCKW